MNSLDNRAAPGKKKQNIEEERGTKMTNVFIVVFAISILFAGFMLFTNTHSKSASNHASSGIQPSVGSQPRFPGPDTSPSSDSAHVKSAPIDVSKMTDREREENMTPFMQSSILNRK